MYYKSQMLSTSLVAPLLAVIVGALYFFFSNAVRAEETPAPLGLANRILPSVLLPVVLLNAVRHIISVSWFEDNAMVTFAYARNLSHSCGYNFNCDAGDFSTSSTLHTFISAIWFAIFNTENALIATKVLEVALVFGAALMIMLFARATYIQWGWALLFIATWIGFKSSYLHLFSGMDNALAAFLISASAFFWRIQKPKTLGVFLALLVLTRPEYLLVALVLFGFDVIRQGGISKQIKTRWAAAGGIAGVIVLVGFLNLLAFNGSFFSNSLSVTRSTAANWGLSYHAKAFDLIKDLGFWLIPFALGLAGLIRKRSEMLVFIILGFATLFIYAIFGMPSAPWLYGTFYLALASCLAGLSIWVEEFIELRHKLRDLAVRFDLIESAKDQRVLYTILASVLVVITLAPHFQSKAVENVNFVTAVGKKRYDINREGGLWANQALGETESFTTPNIGYLGFYSERFVVDLIGLVTPDASHFDSQTQWFDQYRPELYIHKATNEERMLSMENYTFQRMIGRDSYRHERFMVMGRNDWTNLAPSTGEIWTTTGGVGGLEVKLEDAKQDPNFDITQAYAFARFDKTLCNAEGAVMNVTSPDPLKLPTLYSRGYQGTQTIAVFDITPLKDQTSHAIESFSVTCEAGGQKQFRVYAAGLFVSASD